MSRKSFFVTGLLVALLLAGVVSFWASSQPDGLNRVAEDHGLNAQEQDSATANSPLADYETRGIEDAGLSGGLAGVVGVVITFGVAGGAFTLLARRNHGANRAETAGVG